MAGRRKPPKNGESPLVVLSLIVSIGSVLAATVIGIIEYTSIVVTEPELEERIARLQKVTKEEISTLRSQFKSFQFEINLEVFEETIAEKTELLKTLSDAGHTESDRLVIDLRSEIGSLVEQRKALINEYSEVKRDTEKAVQNK